MRWVILQSRSWSLVLGILVWIVALFTDTESLRGSAVVLQARAKLLEPKVDTVQSADDDNSTENGSSLFSSSNSSIRSHLTGIPQIDYVLDPNLPRELNGFNLSDYPFYNELPEEIDFKCDGLHDGFYASVPHKCQVYHHCLFGTRFDFLCANYTAFDQKTFICHFVSEVDCINSPKYYKRNEALYKQATTTTPPTTTTTTTPAPPTASLPNHSSNGGSRPFNRGNGRRRRPYRRRRPMYEYYYDDEEYLESDYYEDDIAPVNHRRSQTRRKIKDPHEVQESRDSEPGDYDEPAPPADLVKPSSRASSISSSIYERPRAAPKIRRPVPKNERDKYDYVRISTSSTTSTTQTPATTPPVLKKSSPTPAPSLSTASEDEYYEDDEYEYEFPKKGKPSKSHAAAHSDYDWDEGAEGEDSRRGGGSRPRPRQHGRKRTDTYDDYEIVRPRMNRRKEYSRYDDRARGRLHRGKPRAPPEDHASGHKKRVMEGEYRSRRPYNEDDYYMDDDDKETHLPPARTRPPKPTEKPKLTKATATKPPPPFTTSSPSSAAVEYTTRFVKPSMPHSAKTTTTEGMLETSRDNEITTTGNPASLLSRGPGRFKTVKIVTNSIREDAEDAEEGSSTNAAAVRPPGPGRTLRPDQKRLPAHTATTAPEDPSFAAIQSNTTSNRHFMPTSPLSSRSKPSHFFANLYQEPKQTPPPPITNDQYHQSTFTQLPSQQQQQLHTFRPATFPAYYVTKSKPPPPPPPPPPDHLSENFNSIASALGFNPQTYAAAEQKAQPAPSNMFQSQRLFQGGQDHRLFPPPNGIIFSRRQPPTYEITAPGPSAPAEDLPAPSNKKYQEVAQFNGAANVDYDPNYNDALQPSTLHPIRRYPSPSFYVQTQSRRHVTNGDFHSDPGFGALNRSQNRYK